MNRTFKTLSVLLGYPEQSLVAAAPELKDALAEERLLTRPLRTDLNGLIDDLSSGDLLDLQERYVMLFDRTRTLSLHLFEHVHGESRDRGQAMVDLQLLYEQHGLRNEASELPDYLPLFLEFLATRPFDEARALLGEPLHVIRALAERHRKRGSPYTSVFLALEALADAIPEPEALAELLATAEDDPDDLEALDKAWADEPIAFGPGAGCAAAMQSSPKVLRRNPEVSVSVNVSPPERRTRA